jgi:hypothetical protein
MITRNRYNVPIPKSSLQKIDRTRFKKTLTNSSEFVDYIKKHDNSIPVKQIDKTDLEEVIKEMILGENVKEYIRGLELPYM